MFFIAGISIAIFIEFLLLSKKNKSKSDMILIIWMLIIILHLSLFYGHYTETIYDFPFILGVELPMPLFHGVFLYLYVASVTKQFPKRNTTIALHFLPLLGFYIYLIEIFKLPMEEKINIFKNEGAGYETFSYVLYDIFVPCSGVIYVVWSIILLSKHKRNILNNFSNLEQVNLKWLQFLTIGIGGIWALVIILEDDFFIFIGVVVFVFLLGYFGINQGEIYTLRTVEDQASNDNQNIKKYAKSGLDEKQSKILYSNLKNIMHEDVVYKNGDLSISDLASILGTNSNHLSQIINEQDGKNFYDFVNSYRVEEFIRLLELPENKNFTLLALANECGFNSKSSFNRHFKKHTGKTPSEYFNAIKS